MVLEQKPVKLLFFKTKNLTKRGNAKYSKAYEAKSLSNATDHWQCGPPWHTMTGRPIMSDRIQKMFAGRTILCDGAMGTTLYARGVFINRCYDELNLSQPDLIRSVHEDYLQAGAELIETNTFGANAFRLSRYGFQDQVFAINKAGA